MPLKCGKINEANIKCDTFTGVIAIDVTNTSYARRMRSSGAVPSKGRESVGAKRHVHGQSALPAEVGHDVYQLSDEAGEGHTARTPSRRRPVIAAPHPTVLGGGINVA